MKIFQSTFKSLSTFNSIKQARKEHITPVSLTGLSLVQRAQLAYTLSEEENILIITGDEAEAKRLCDDINTMANENIAMPFPSHELVLAQIESVSYEYVYSRISALSALQNGSCKIIVASIEAVLQPTMPPQQLKRETIYLNTGDSVDQKELVQKLVSIGYSRCEAVEGAGQFSVRGDIVDIFPVQSVSPVRMELWGDDIDTISVFDPQTQRRIQSIENFSIAPAKETLCDLKELSEKIRNYSETIKGKYSETAKEILLSEAEQLESGVILQQVEKYYPLVHEKPSTIFDYGFKTVIFNEFASVFENARNILTQYQEDYKIYLESGTLCRGLEGYYQEFSYIQELAEKCFCIYSGSFLQSGERVEYKKLLNIDSLQTAPWGGEMRQLTEDLISYCQQGYCVMLAAGSEKTLNIIQSDLQESGISCEIMKSDSIWKKSVVYLMTGSFSSGFEYPEIKTALITQARALRSGKRLKHKKRGEEIRNLSDIAVGDLVVHALHGIGRFLGIRKLELEGITKDYITIQYSGNENLYVPVTQLDMVSKYIGPRDDTGVRLNKLSSPEWQKTRNNVKRAVKDMAKELTELYAKREKVKGFAFYPDDSVQHEFEERFPYIETDDQLQAIEEIKHDMQRERPMDRLLCGDVGFGKTEVALRAAMKCILSGKQCAILVPTTVLAMQHYQTAVRRFEQFPVNVVLLSRFRTAKQQKEALEQMKSGVADLIIGTHRIVQKDVKFHALGLAIVDEEQRFGVGHKEKFKQMFPEVDMLTLSATPIPRTLNMAMSGIRDMSVIAEPPQDRYPVQTYVMEWNLGVLVQAIRRELKRGGQVYYIHNRVETMQFTAAKLQEMLPDARIAVANGQMDESNLSKIWQQLIDYEIDILVCTTIIETGVDVPNVNTLIIEDSDRFGLSQLYQLRGRVGRSNRRGYAYFTFKKDKVLSEVSVKRLNAMREFTQFGSGFHIAMRDLEIRGAGSILGGRQHGHMEAVGYDMYLKLLSEAIAEERGEPVKSTSECAIDIQIDAHIPETYIESLRQRLDIYRKIASLKTKEEEFDLLDELVDRYGEPPKAILGLISVSLLRNSASELGITEISQRNGSLYFYINTPTQNQITALAIKYRGKIIFNSLKRPYIGVKIDPKIKPMEMMREVICCMEDAENKNS